MSELDQDTLDFEEVKKMAGPVECLGQTFESDEVRRDYYLGLLAEKLKEPEVRKMPGFPMGSDEDILRLSDPPYYTACPNPFLADVVAVSHSHKNNSYEVRTPYATDVSEGKSDPIYNAHSYHTKVPPRAIERFVEHYTQPGDIVLDCFCGTGMTGVACSARGTAAPDQARVALLADLSPFATHIASNTTTPLDVDEELAELAEVLYATEMQYGHLYEVDTGDCDQKGSLEYLVWTEWFLCSDCGAELSFYEQLMKHGDHGRLTRFPCDNCGAEQVKKSLRPAMETVFDPVLNRPIHTTRTTPVITVLNSLNGDRVRRSSLAEDVEHLERVVPELATAPVPVVEIPFMHMTHERNDLPGKGITHVHHFYTWRNLLVLAEIWNRISSPWSRFLFTSVCDRHAVRRNRYIFNKHNPRGRVNGPLSNTLFVPPLQVEMNVFSIFKRKMQDLRRTTSKGRPIRRRTSFVTTQSASSLNNIPDLSVDYVFVDPPFGGNILYSDLNIIAESWLGVRTARDSETVVDESREKDFLVYQHAMAESFSELHRKLKPGRWITVEFHNSSNAIWTAIQTALGIAGFVVADVRFFDKGSGTIHQDTKASAVKKDLLISAYRPRESFESAFALSHDTPESVWAFVSEHLGNVPLFEKVANDSLGVVSERTDQVLFDRMIGFFVQRAIGVPMGSAEFFAGLDERYPKRDGMYFLHGQVSEYDRKRITVSELRQLDLFISDEASATHWIRQQLQNKPQTFQDLQPEFMQQLQSWAKHEKTIELKEILELNFFRYDGDGPVPGQIHSYLSTNFKDMRKLDKGDARLKAKAMDRWYVPDPKKEGDLEKLRLRALLKEFEQYRVATSRKIRQFRTEAIRAGFKHCYDEQDYQTIVDVAAKLPEQVIQEDEKLLMYYDVASMRLGI